MSRDELIREQLIASENVQYAHKKLDKLLKADKFNKYELLDLWAAVEYRSLLFRNKFQRVIDSLEVQ